jgi:hypothetical protein
MVVMSGCRDIPYSLGFSTGLSVTLRFLGLALNTHLFKASLMYRYFRATQLAIKASMPTVLDSGPPVTEAASGNSI